MFTGPQVCTLADITYRQLDYWTRLDVTHPIDEQNPGSGNPRTFTIEELFVIVVVADLIKLGMGTGSASRLASWLRYDTAAHGSLFIDADGYVLNEPVGSCYIVDLDLLRESLDVKVADLAVTSRP